MEKTTSKTPAKAAKKSSRATRRQPKKRIVFFFSDKGGVGKSFSAIHFVEWINRDHPDIKYKAWDPDFKNKTLYNYHSKNPSVSFLDITDSSNLDAIGTCLADVDLSICDGLGAFQSKIFGEWMDEINLWSIASEIDATITFALLIENDRDLIRQARQTFEWAPAQTEFLIIVNEHRYPISSLWKESVLREDFIKSGAIEITLPVAKNYMCTAMQDFGVPMQRIVEVDEQSESPKLNLFDQKRFLTYTQKIHTVFESASARLLP